MTVKREQASIALLVALAFVTVVGVCLLMIGTLSNKKTDLESKNSLETTTAIEKNDNVSDIKFEKLSSFGDISRYPNIKFKQLDEITYIYKDDRTFEVSAYLDSDTLILLGKKARSPHQDDSFPGYGIYLYSSKNDSFIDSILVSTTINNIVQLDNKTITYTVSDGYSEMYHIETYHLDTSVTTTLFEGVKLTLPYSVYKFKVFQHGNQYYEHSQSIVPNRCPFSSLKLLNTDKSSRIIYNQFVCNHDYIDQDHDKVLCVDFSNDDLYLSRQRYNSNSNIVTEKLVRRNLLSGEDEVLGEDVHGAGRESRYVFDGTFNTSKFEHISCPEEINSTHLESKEYSRDNGTTARNLGNRLNQLGNPIYELRHYPESKYSENVTKSEVVIFYKDDGRVLTDTFVLKEGANVEASTWGSMSHIGDLEEGDYLVMVDWKFKQSSERLGELIVFNIIDKSKRTIFSQSYSDDHSWFGDWGGNVIRDSSQLSIGQIDTHRIGMKGRLYLLPSSPGRFTYVYVDMISGDVQTYESDPENEVTFVTYIDSRESGLIGFIEWNDSGFGNVFYINPQERTKNLITMSNSNSYAIPDGRDKFENVRMTCIDMRSKVFHNTSFTLFRSSSFKINNIKRINFLTKQEEIFEVSEMGTTIMHKTSESGTTGTFHLSTYPYDNFFGC